MKNGTCPLDSLLQPVLDHGVDLGIVAAGMPDGYATEVVLIDDVHESSEVQGIGKPDLVSYAVGVSIVEVGASLGILDNLGSMLLSQTNGVVIGNASPGGSPIITIGGQAGFQFGGGDDGHCIIQNLANPAGWGNGSGIIPAVIIEHEADNIHRSADPPIIVADADGLIGAGFRLDSDVEFFVIRRQCSFKLSQEKDKELPVGGGNIFIINLDAGIIHGTNLTDDLGDIALTEIRVVQYGGDQLPIVIIGDERDQLDAPGTCEFNEGGVFGIGIKEQISCGGEFIPEGRKGCHKFGMLANDGHGLLLYPIRNPGRKGMPSSRSSFRYLDLLADAQLVGIDAGVGGDNLIEGYSEGQGKLVEGISGFDGIEDVAWLRPGLKEGLISKWADNTVGVQSPVLLKADDSRLRLRAKDPINGSGDVSQLT